MKKLYIVTFILLSLGFNKALGQSITLGSVPSTLCANESFDIPITLSGFSFGNSMVAQLSAADGTFPVTPTVIGTASVNSDGLHYIQAQIPSSTTFSTSYNIRVSSAALPTVISAVSGNIDINCTTNDYYWVGGSGDWSDYTNHWSNASDGAPGAYANEPTTNDNVYFDGNSFPSGGQITLTAESFCNDMIWSDGSTNPIIYGAYPNNLNVRGDFILVNGVYNDLRTIYFNSIKQNIKVDFADNLIQGNSNTYWYPRAYFYSPGSWSLQSDVYEFDNFDIYATLNTNDHQISSRYSVYVSGTLNAGSSTINTSYFYGYGIINSTSLTLNLTEDINGNNPEWYGNNSYGNVTISSSICKIHGSNTISNLSILPEAGMSLQSGTTQTITSSLNATGTREHMVTINSQTPGSQATLFVSGASVTADFVKITDNVIDNGALGIYNATNAINGLNNTNWNFSSLLSALDYYWVGGSGDWSDTNHWATSDGGSAFYSSPPGFLDNVFFTSSSFTSTGETVAITEDAHCHNMIWQTGSGTNSPDLQSNFPIELITHGSLQFDDGVIRNLYRINFNSDDIGNTINMADNQFNGGDIDFNGSGEWTLQSALSTDYLNIRGGTLHTNDKTININYQLYVNNSGGITYWGSSNVNLRYINYNGPASAFDTESSTFNFNSPVYTSYSYIYGSPVFNNLNFEGSLSFLYGNLIANNLSINPGADITLSDGYTHTIYNNLIAEGTRDQFIFLHSPIEGSFATLDVNTTFGTNLSVEFAKIQDISLDNGSGFTTPELASQSIDNGGNTGWDFLSVPLAGLDFYWVGGSGYWSDGGHWAASSGGTDFYNYPPLEIDNVYFDANSFPSGGTLTLDYPVTVHDMDWNGNTSNVTITHFDTWDNTLTLSGSLTLSNGVTRDININFNSDNSGNSIFMADNLYTSSRTYFNGSGDWLLAGDYAAEQTYFNGGTFNTNNFDFTSTVLSLNNDNITYWGSSNIYTSRFENYLNTPSDFNSETSTFNFNDPSQNIILGANSIFNNVVFEGNSFVYDNNQFANLTMGEGTSLSLLDGSIQTITNSLTLAGTADKPIVINSFTDGAAATFSALFGVAVNADFVHLQDNTATGGAIFTATNSSDFGNVMGWSGLKTGQTIDFPLLTDQPLSSGAFTVSASSSSSLDVSFEVASGSATSSGTNGTTITPSGSGLVAIKATQTGNSTFGNAYPVTQYIYIDATEEPNELGNMKEARLVLGQPDNVTNDFIFTSTSTAGPYQVAVSSTGQMAVGQRRRLLIWNKIPDNSTTPADVVIGQVDFDSSDGTASASASSFSPAAGNPTAYSVHFSNSGKLIVSDYNRVLIWNTIPTTNNTPADIVLGQPDFTSTNNSISESEYGGGVITATTYYDGGSGNEKLIVSDPGNNRVLIYNTIPTASFTAADVVIGQPDFYSNSSGNGADQLYGPEYCSVSSDGKLLIADFYNNRVVGFNSIPTSNGASADLVLGQADFGFSDPDIGSNSLYRPYGLSISRTNKLAITDFGNNRVLIYNTLPTNNTVPPDYVLGQPDANSNGISAISGRTMNFAVNASWDLSENLFVSDRSNNRVLLFGEADLEGPVVESTALLQPQYTIGAADQKSTLVLSDRSGISEVIGYYNDINYIDNENPTYEQVLLTDVGNNNFEFNLNDIESLSSNPTGIEYFIEAYDNLGNVVSTADNKQVLPIYYPDGISINGYGVGNATENYRIMAVPAELDNQAVEHVFQDIFSSGYDNTEMRIFSYAGGSATTYNEASGSTNLQVGTGYFALAASGSSSSVTSPDGALTSFISTDDGSGENIHEYVINLVNGWNLIGNPFQHDVVWNDVKALSGITAGQVDNLQNYTGSYTTITTIPAGGGAFVSNNTGSNFTLRIPAKINSGGRMKGLTENDNPLSEPSWEVWLRAYNANNEEVVLGGIGMEEDADLSKDQYDWLNPPAFSRMKLIEFSHPEFREPSFKKDIRETSMEEKWQFMYKVDNPSNNQQELHWDNTHFGDGSPDIYLVDKTHYEVVNMKEKNSYTFYHGGNTEFEIYFGDKALEEIMPEEVISQSPFPNPFTNEVNFKLGLPNGENYQVEIRIFDTVGKTVRYISKDDINAGYNSIIWDGLNTDGRILPGGIYAYSIHIKGAKIDSVTSGKLIKR